MQIKAFLAALAITQASQVHSGPELTYSSVTHYLEFKVERSTTVVLGEVVGREGVYFEDLPVALATGGSTDFAGPFYKYEVRVLEDLTGDESNRQSVSILVPGGVVPDTGKFLEVSNLTVHLEQGQAAIFFLDLDPFNQHYFLDAGQEGVWTPDDNGAYRPLSAALRQLLKTGAKSNSATLQQVREVAR